MGITNRSYDVSEQVKVFNANNGAVATGATVILLNVPYPCILQDIRVSAIGLSGSPAWTFLVGRTVAAGFTMQAVAGALTVQAVGTSGPQRASLLASGSTLLNLDAGDHLAVVTATANTNTLSSCVDIVLKATQDIKSNYGVVAS